jgi:seryl-tRNA synthetase
MIDLALLRESPEHTIELIKRKDQHFDAQLLFDLDFQVRQLRQKIEALRHQKNDLAKQARTGLTDKIRSHAIEVNKLLKAKEKDLEALQKKFNDLYLRCPNIPENDVPLGNKESNVVVHTEGTKPAFTFPIKNHVELGNALGWFDFEAAAKITGSNFALYKGDAVKLLYALAMFMLKHNIKNGYEVVLPPALVNEQSLIGASNFPKFRDQVYEVEKDELYLTPTAEVDLVNMYRDHIFSDELPKRMTAWTSCFRREAGTYGAHERGLIRIHQFEKVELVTISDPDKSNEELERMLTCAQDILKKLGLHYRVSLLAAQDCSFPSAKTYDIEVWLPGQEAYYEVSSVSNCTDFQARRCKIRTKDVTGKNTLVHTLNGSSLALPRLMVAIMETYQQKDGSIIIPDVLKHEGLF